ncbi:NmrA-like family protein [Cryphonectria parasitica EP155]|uniref:NmrA-like family protein n=1 Tax=Cryphonectria parasitica (strain ATCC 38755 / EP155) TaxID=660469 RepID=A0A9P4XSW6_CRYP1|nr:NmrA-like family protein [Cryphonectria parasitica EP155]KAF3760704.1 NmrA-like family protein [Cryphonectria parasitica EP155]
MAVIHKVAIFGASGNFGAPITAALLKANFDITIISRTESPSTSPPNTSVLKIAYTLEGLTAALQGQDAVVNVIGPGGKDVQDTITDAAEAAGVKRLIVNDFGWGANIRGLPEFREVHDMRMASWEHAMQMSAQNGSFTWTGISIGNPIDWAMAKFPTMGFDMKNSSATIYDQGEERFTGTTLQGIGQSVVGVLQHPDETANRFVKVMSVMTCQNELLRALEAATDKKWAVEQSTTSALMERGRAKHRDGDRGWVLDLVVAQLLDEGQARCVVAPSREEADSDLLGVEAESVEQVVLKALELRDVV